MKVYAKLTTAIEVEDGIRLAQYMEDSVENIKPVRQKAVWPNVIWPRSLKALNNKGQRTPFEERKPHLNPIPEITLAEKAYTE